jgi:hypothetical protein
MGEGCGTHERVELIRNFVGKDERKRLLGRPVSEWENNTRIDCREIVWENVDWIYVAQDRDQWRDLVKAVHSGSISGGKFLD